MIFSFMYTRAGAPPGRTWVVEAAARSAIGAEPTPLVSAIVEFGFGGASVKAGIEGARTPEGAVGGCAKEVRTKRNFSSKVKVVR